MNIDELRKELSAVREKLSDLNLKIGIYRKHATWLEAEAKELIRAINAYESNPAPKGRNPGALPDLSRIHFVVSYNDNNEIVSIIPCHSETEFYATFHAQARRFPYVEGGYRNGIAGIIKFRVNYYKGDCANEKRIFRKSHSACRCHIKGGGQRAKTLYAWPR